jgi:O-6-methylguanine DNA methyltransferase
MMPSLAIAPDSTLVVRLPLVGLVRLTAHRGQLVRLDLNIAGSPVAVESNWGWWTPIVLELRQYLRGERREWGLQFRTGSLAGTPWQRRVWVAMQRISYGQTRSYRWLAEQIGQPTAVRAVANACGRNPLPIIIPCHRVIKSDGSWGGYSCGLNIKKALLKLERAAIPQVNSPLTNSP